VSDWTSAHEAWEELAVSSRSALRLLGYGGPACLPGEPDACGGTFYEHAVAHLGALRAIVDHHLTHVNPSARSLIAAVAEAAVAKDLDLCE
jgi:hypothetical protein